MSEYKIISITSNTEEDFRVKLMLKEYALNSRKEKALFVIELEKFVCQLAKERDDFMNRLENIKKEANWDDPDY